jgi:hypothetical protein
MNGEVVGLVTSMLGLRDKEDGNIQMLQNASCVLNIGSLEKLLPLLPKRDPAMEVLPRASGSLETLAELIEGFYTPGDSKIIQQRKSLALVSFA